MSTASDIEQILSTGRELHRMLNSANPPADLNERYNQLWERQARLSLATKELLAISDFEINMHDAWIENFSERKIGTAYNSCFCARVNAIDSIGESGLVRLDFQIKSRDPVRQMAGKEIYCFLVDPESKKLGATFHRPGQNMGQVVVDYLHIDVQAGPFVNFEEIRKQRLAATPKVEATLRVYKDSGQEEYPARWYTDGSIEVFQGNEWIGYSNFSDRRYASDIPGVKKIVIDTGIEGICAQVGADSEDNGPSYNNTKPLKKYLRSLSKLRNAKIANL